MNFPLCSVVNRAASSPALCTLIIIISCQSFKPAAFGMQLMFAATVFDAKATTDIPWKLIHTLWKLSQTLQKIQTSSADNDDLGHSYNNPISFFSTALFQIKRLLKHSSSESAIMIRSSAWSNRNCRGQLREIPWNQTTDVHQGSSLITRMTT